MSGPARARRARGRPTGRCAVALALGLSLALAAGAEVRRMEAVGAVGIVPDAPSPVPLREAALDKALGDAVRRVALEQVDPTALEATLATPGEISPDSDAVDGTAGVLDAALGNDPRSYATRFRILEDRGERPALFVEDPEVQSEYVIVVEVYVDADRVRQRLERGGIPLLSAEEVRRVRVRVVLLDLESYAALAAVREALLDGVGAESVIPVEMERGRSVLAVESDREPSELLAQLLRVVPPELSVDPVLARGQTLTLRVRLASSPSGEASALRPAAIDTTGPNRY